jgi:hypothetical protein
MHASQMKMLFGDVANIEREIQNYAQRVGTIGKPRERFWSSQDALNHHSK